MKQKQIIITFLIMLLPSVMLGQNKGYEQAKKLIEEVQSTLSSNKILTFNFSQTSHSLGHLAEPWQTNKLETSGSFFLMPNTEGLYISDSVQFGGNYYHSKQFYTTDSLYEIGYGAGTPNKVTIEDARNYINTAVLFSPAFYLNDFLTTDISYADINYAQGSSDTVTYKRANGNIIRFLINKTNKHISAIHVTYHHELYGDVVKQITYSEYRQHPETKTYYATLVTEEELGIQFSEIHISHADSELDIEKIKAVIPSDYKLVRLQPEEPEISYQKFNDHIHLLDFQHTDDRILIVEFEDFLLVAEAPLNTQNGQLIIEHAEKIAPGKPIKYFVFGHHHPHYIGGIRAFVANGTTILSYKDNVDYAEQIISFKHYLKPDALEKNRKEPIIEVIDSIKAIKDNELEMQIIHIGEMSAHTKDYLIYYFPKYKLLFEDDLVWIAKDKPLEPASSRQKGLYDAIVKHGLVVDKIVQSWPVKEHGVKTIIDFEELKRSVELIGKE